MHMHYYPLSGHFFAGLEPQVFAGYPSLQTIIATYIRNPKP
jgi:hypothetical protein